MFVPAPLPLAGIFGGTLIGVFFAVVLLVAFIWSFLRCLDATDGINRNRKDQDSDA